MEEEEKVWEAAKTSVMLVSGVIFSILVIAFLNAFGYIDGSVNIDPWFLILLLGAFLSAGMFSYLIQEMEIF